MRAEAERSIIVLPQGRATAVVAWCRQRPRQVVASVLVALTVLTGFWPPALTATAETPAISTGGAPVEIAEGDPYYPIPLLARPADGPVPTGKGMWLHRLTRAENGDVGRIVNQAVNAGLTHLYVRVGSSKSGFYAQNDLDRLLPVAHAAGLKVVGWDFPYLNDPFADAARAREQIWYATPTGHRIDAFSADIETPAEGTHLSAAAIQGYIGTLRQYVGPGYPLIATVPRPSAKRSFPYASLVPGFDAIAPMVYWGNRDPAADVQGAIANLAFLGKPVIPVGQAYDMAQDGAPRIAHGAPSKQAVARFIDAAAGHGAKGVSFWVWDTATADHWAAITEASDPRITGRP